MERFEIGSVYSSSRYMEELAKFAGSDIWDSFSSKSFAISGGTGMIGSYLIDLIMYRNDNMNQNSHVYVFGRNEEKAEKRFEKYYESPFFHFIYQDINKEIDAPIEKVDYIIHAASNTHPVAYSSDPIGTVAANVIGTANLLEWACKVSCERFAFLSSVEIYGENRGDVEKFKEDYLGYIDCNTLRAGYPESKRTGEALCQAYISQKGLDVVIPRLSRTYGPTMLMSDTKALSQFIKKCVDTSDIVLKSEGLQEFSYGYVADAVIGILTVIAKGTCGEAYNISSDGSDISLRELAGILAEYNGKKVVFELPDSVEMKGYSTATKAMLDTDKVKSIGWKSSYEIKEGLIETVLILREIKK
ncbi:MAG: NAD-dependent epimerase/dehydratase family protein [Lachnospiraceae bacterium]|nr:NAD-dependent epimerase/dehydratase family protein [Lachnospiraceae bacterium]